MDRGRVDWILDAVWYQSVVSSTTLELLRFAWSAATVHVRGCTGTTVSAQRSHHLHARTCCWPVKAKFHYAISASEPAGSLARARPASELVADLLASW